MTIILAPIAAILAPLLSLAILALAIMGMINASKKKMAPLPIVGEYADRYLNF